ncbi:uncharacterized protein LOC113679111 [Pocillopora damicornis]|uniref:uncharacterized protein LOC113679111 n=1 Tax=Pocillopora damicornis TaxID=46731 RepID=UPI000F551546|nr:uncharacterized protein LOC113679111 [Pocillopora damicornis]
MWSHIVSEKLHRVFYFSDYADIRIYTYTSGQVMFFDNRPTRTGWRIFESALFYTIIGARKFDIIGSSHHFLHIFGALSTEYAFKILQVAIEGRKDARN